MLPVVFGWRTIFSRQRGKAGTITYFACLGLGYIVVEVGLIANFVLALSNATVLAARSFARTSPEPVGGGRWTVDGVEVEATGVVARVARGSKLNVRC